MNIHQNARRSPRSRGEMVYRVLGAGRWPAQGAAFLWRALAWFRCLGIRVRQLLTDNAGASPPRARRALTENGFCVIYALFGVPRPRSVS